MAGPKVLARPSGGWGVGGERQGARGLDVGPQLVDPRRGQVVGVRAEDVVRRRAAPGDVDQAVFVYSTPPGSASRQAMDLLASWSHPAEAVRAR